MKQRAHWFARNEQAEALEKAGRKAEAQALYEANAREGCDLSFTYERLGTLYAEQGKLEQALEAFEQARRIEQQRGPSARLIRLIRQIEALQRRLQQQTSRQSTRSLRSRATVERDSQLPRVTAITKQRKGCLGVVLLGLLGISGLFGGLLS
ncbi:MAG: tetratricopeptide repeat protein [Rhodothermus sp.]|nr:tetratricopeptide repeat protein [Rhodothermus sp.]